MLIHERGETSKAVSTIPEESFQASEQIKGTQEEPHNLSELRRWKWASRGAKVARVSRADTTEEKTSQKEGKKELSSFE